MNNFDEPYTLNLDNKNLVASLLDCPPTIEYGHHISAGDRELIANLQLYRTDCGTLEIYKYNKDCEFPDHLKAEIIAHHVHRSPGCPSDNCDNPQTEPNTYNNGECAFYWCRTIDGAPLKDLLKSLFGVDQFLSCICFSIEDRMYLTETPDHYWVFDLEV